MRNIYKITTKWLISHVLLAFLAVYVPGFARAWGVAALAVGLFYTIRSNNKNQEAVLCVAYFSGLEITLRMLHATIGYEMAKYAVLGFLLLGLILEKNKPKKNPIWIVGILLLMPSMFITDNFEDARFSVAGIVALLYSAYYFQGRTVDRYTFTKILSFMLLPIISTAIVITLRTPDYSTITFTADSNAVTSGGFGPIHVSTVLSVGLLILILLLLLGQNIFKFQSKWLYYGIILLLAFRLIFTFARSGLFSLVVALVVSFIFFSQSRDYKRQKSFTAIIAIAAVFIVAWLSIDSITGGMSTNRFTGRDNFGDKKEDVTTGRSELNNEDIVLFLQNPMLGVGAGNVAQYRMVFFQDEHTSHMEYTRLLAEHGILGLLVVLLVFIEPLRNLKKTRGWTRLFFLAFVSFTLTNMVPGATRTALPMLIYGLGFIRINEDYL